MNKKAIWLVIGLMGVALLGTVILQFYWINWSVKLNEKQFDDHIITALKRVADKLEKEKENWELSQIEKWIQEGNRPLEDQKRLLEYATLLMSNQISAIMDSSSFSTLDPEYSWDKKKEIVEMIDRELRIHPAGLEQRINPQKLSALLKHEFDELNLNLKYSFGVYDNAHKSLVILNENYVVDLATNTNASRSDIEDDKVLTETSYRVALFSTASGSPGILKVVFPTKQSWLWKSVLPIVFLSLLLTGLILGCFIYVIYVIFRQKKLSEIKNDFVNNMTHEFKTPIATISLASDSILSPMIIQSPDKIRRFMDIIKQENRRMLSQVEKVLQMALLDKHDFQLNLKSLDIHEIIREAVRNISLQVNQKNGQIHEELGASNAILRADQTHMTNIIYNLLDNANKYSMESPSIRIITENAKKGIQIKVIDTGIGMTKDAQKMIFEKFYRVPTGNLHDVKGFGLGLSYVKAMVQAHNGTIEVSSEPGKGSTFTLYFPN
ncbi:MAG: HAMP domain-containing histidine kinase [Saprospiraceae bacterium]|nr:HAMP domain-containing histidine kinase [Candidatus Vicinibacter proximus]MBL7823335.1 HAMP domain-containing histidine kinase [Saprospiraceae bacterium]MCC6844317.1 HAMP domain-containing histidine kinase [Saprospiraceae bacterium]HRG32608.1 HAMP domain-containing sensor histidine kinase [Saprospiraceae bacterium]